MTFNRLLFFILIATIPVHAVAQRSFSIRREADIVRRLLSITITLNPRDNEGMMGDTITALNDEIAQRLTHIFQSPASMKYSPDTLLKSMGLTAAGSSDKRLWIISIYENTGGSWKSNINVVHYRTKANKPKAEYGSINTEGHELNDLFSSGAAFYKIYKLHATGRDLYLCLGEGMSCNTCTYRVACVVELAADSIRYNYPAFHTAEDGLGSQLTLTASYTVEARVGNIRKFSFDPKSQTLTTVMKPDDLNSGARTYKGQIKEKLVFDGKRFR